MNEYFGNMILYRMCEENIKHESVEKVAGKLWLISRSYAVSPQRRKRPDNINTDRYEFFFDNIAELFIQNSKSRVLDNEIERLSSASYTCDFDNDEELLYNTIVLVDLFNNLMIDVMKKYDKIEIGSVNNHVSLASKYLHFHLPNLVFIYDSYAGKNATKQYKINDLSRRGIKFNKDSDLLTPKVKEIYKPHALKCYAKLCALPQNERTPRNVDLTFLKGI